MNKINEIRKSIGLPPLVSISETYIIGVNMTDTDVEVVTIGKLDGLRKTIIKTLYDDDAVEFYKQISE